MPPSSDGFSFILGMIPSRSLDSLACRMSLMRDLIKDGLITLS